MKLIENLYLIITAVALIVAVIALLVVYLEVDIQYTNHDRFRWICHGLFKWHVPNSVIDERDTDEPIRTSVCKFCNRPIIQIYNGEWKTLDYYDKQSKEE